MAYSVVNKPAEGTILTVARKSAEAAAAHAASGDFDAMLEATLAAAYEALAETPTQNPVLAKAGVVDAGGKGYCFILEGMLAAVRGITVTRDNPEAIAAVTNPTLPPRTFCASSQRRRPPRSFSDAAAKTSCSPPTQTRSTSTPISA